MSAVSNPYQPGPYGSGYGQPHPSGTTVLVLGIIGLVVCPIVSVVGWVQGNRALREIDAAPGVYNNRQTVVIGRILSIVAVGLWAVGIVLYLLLFVVLGVLSTQG
jgi:uncharacterized membrane protein